MNHFFSYSLYFLIYYFYPLNRFAYIKYTFHHILHSPFKNILIHLSFIILFIHPL
ncbi:hypothetical protein H8356DRAFT_1724214 [Neocallimastix lanati (nom. inval.)]|nr:hypothetical protein H8356DRAFT_1724214 [Neocallimastix sp. JGI-2020a]